MPRVQECAGQSRRIISAVELSPVSYTPFLIDFAVRVLELRVGHYPWATVPWAGDVDDVQIVFIDRAIQMHVNKIKPGVVPR